jgi:hypothetical protein
LAYYGYRLFGGFDLANWKLPIIKLAGKDCEAMIHEPSAEKNTTEAVLSLRRLYDDLYSLCKVKIPDRLKARLATPSGEAVEVSIVGVGGKVDDKPSKLSSSSDVKKSPSVYVPDPVFVRLKCDGKYVLVAALLSTAKDPKGPVFFVATGEWVLKSDADLAPDIVERAAQVKDGEDGKGGFTVPFSAFEASRFPRGNDEVDTAIDNHIVSPLSKLLGLDLRT